MHLQKGKKVKKFSGSVTLLRKTKDTGKHHLQFVSVREKRIKELTENFQRESLKSIPTISCFEGLTPLEDFYNE